MRSDLGKMAVVGAAVVSLVHLTDTDSEGVEYTHARPGEPGRIERVCDPLTPSVRWDRTGTLCDCAPDEIQIISRAVIPRG